MSAPRDKQSEKYIEKKLKDAAIKAGGIPVKMALAGAAGFPDRLLIMPEGRTVYVEVKGTGLKLRPLQKMWRRDILALGHEWHFLDHTDDINSIIYPTQLSPAEHVPKPQPSENSKSNVRN